MNETELLLQGAILEPRGDTELGIDASILDRIAKEFGITYERLFKKIKDPKFYLESFVKVKNKEGEMVPFILNEAQKDFLNALRKNNRVIALKCRQIGFSTLTSAYIYHQTITQSGKTSALISYNADSATEFLEKIKQFHRTTPEAIRPQLSEDSKYVMKFPVMDDSKIVVLSGDSKNVGSGYTFQYALISELAKWENAEGKMTSLQPALPVSSKVIVESTPVGMTNYFADLWFNDKNGYEKREYPWNWLYTEDEIDYIFRVTCNGDELKFAQEYECFEKDMDVITRDGVKFIQDIKIGDYVLSHTNRYNKVIDTKQREYNGNIYTIHVYGNNKPIKCTENHPFLVCNDGINHVWKMAKDLTKEDRLCFVKLSENKYDASGKIISIKKEVKNTIVYNLHVQNSNSYTVNGIKTHNCSFLTSGRGVFDQRQILKHRENILKEGDQRQIYGKTFTIYKTIDDLVVYREPEVDHTYIMGADTSEGVTGGDSSHNVIFDRATGEEVASFNGLIDPDLFGTRIDGWGRWYNNALAVVEKNKDGGTVINALRRLMYPSIYRSYSNDDKISMAISDKMGWRTTPTNRYFMIDDYRAFFRDNLITIHSKIILDEMTWFIYNNENKAVAAENKHDDSVMAVAVALQGFKQTFVGDLEQPDFEEMYNYTNGY